MLGITVVWLGTLTIIRGLGTSRSSEEDERTDSINLRRSFLFCLAVASLWFAEATLTKTTGSFRGLYCAVELGGINGIIVMTAVTGSFSVMGYCIFQAYKILSTPHVGDGTPIETGDLETRLRHSLGKLALKMTAAYVACWGGVTVYCLLRLAGLQPPIEFAMLASLNVKFAPIFNVLLILNSTQYKGRAVSPATVADKSKTSPTSPSSGTLHSHQ
jgi:hypothetical protein